MSARTESNELRTRFNTQWANRIPVAWPGKIFKPPSPPAPWCRFSIKNSDGGAKSIGSPGSNIHRYPGTIFVQIFVPIDEGDAAALDYGDQAVAIYHGWYGTNITCEAGTVKTIGETGDGFYQVNAVIPFYRDELK